MAKLRKILMRAISTCDDCDHVGMGGICLKVPSPRFLPESVAGRIPSWCPLPDAEDDDAK